jgi:DNA-binding MarR family transcriptional regulator
MPGAFSSDDERELRQAERDVTHAFDTQPFDFSALLAVSNVFRAATAVRNHMEREVLSPHQLSWSAFVVLFVLRVWGARESNELAAEAGITGGTLTGVLSTLERRGFAKRKPHATDGRRVVVHPTAKGSCRCSTITRRSSLQICQTTIGASWHGCCDRSCGVSTPSSQSMRYGFVWIQTTSVRSKETRDG